MERGRKENWYVEVEITKGDGRGLGCVDSLGCDWAVIVMFEKKC